MKATTLTLGLVFGLLSSIVGAQELTKPACHQPPMPNDLSSDTVIKYFNKHRVEYEKCINSFVDEQKGIVDANQKSDPAKANLAHDSAEAALKEYNEFVSALNEHAKAKAE